MLTITGELDATDVFTDLRFADGRVVRLPTTLLQVEQPVASSEETRSNEPAQIVVPVSEEQLEISKRTVPTAVVHLEKHVQSFDVRLDEPIAIVSWKVERIAVCQVVETAPSVRQEGETTIYPVLEEQALITKQLVLVEEVRVSRELSEQRDTRTITLRREHWGVQREAVLAK